MKIINTKIKDVLIIEPDVYCDNRGSLSEYFSLKDFNERVCKTTFVQDNESKSSYGVLRGLHFQKPPHAQSKLVRVVKGAVFDVAVDIRRESPTFGQYVSVELSVENNKQFFIPRGFAHGFVVLSDEAVFQYKCDHFYAPQSEGSIIWNDPEINIIWPIPIKDIILSEKDKKSPLLKDSKDLFDYSEDLYRI